MNILFEDNHIIAVEKPPGIPTQPQIGLKKSLEETIKLFIKERDKKPKNVFLHAIFRLDTPASGIVLFAKSQKALSFLQKALQAHRFKKEYLALVQKAVPLGIHTCYLVHGDKIAHICHSSTPAAKKASLIITGMTRHPPFFQLTIELLTGRYHQIRAQLASLGSPIVGDKKYGSTLHNKEHSISLHHTKLSFPHPITKQIVTIYCPSRF